MDEGVLVRASGLGKRYGETDWRELRKRIGLVSSSIRQLMADDLIQDGRPVAQAGGADLEANGAITAAALDVIKGLTARRFHAADGLAGRNLARETRRDIADR